MTWTLSNQLTVSRVLLIPLLAIAFYVPGKAGYVLAAALFGLASATDWLDGYLARSRNEITAFGRFLDPVADKLLVATALVLLVEADRAPALLAAIIIGREIVISALREWLAQVSSIVHVSSLAKWKTAVQMVAVVCLLLHITVFGINMHLTGIVLLWIAALLTLWSAYEYLRDAWGVLIDDDTPSENDKEQPVITSSGGLKADS
ncbi:MAG: CDP-diacylglycerol--glycerol-3-phosphate 3-phosphatidyltransferase [Zetaproteobacteria bacterium CG12_big_fil_rev_8_21_14_0_65_55_1124]|nr:MAG: CDP-diacylglycerol--glycerol-3-phosphate 3-phosphatidyltransferase [Zetaproteobacteria bacterium CG1_02_55_237]PIS19378.1 MAG: CDP-diacylglycerol--glycerol-3-phosphate 3-phosphatidyltransferase [Zetaproteobacteria bacterium CG08_land_8_20_14_0_20_55_17]PIW43422.1 MAG: CDP-diacylglycerol--glycerol-3-phosphate 3-phosphatidyltransferase [Zetaproteobacteria bacterium CG12_big_fil_rev_8_21_14_0_65_55_1124]PIY53619.1 MAG: CDP-diacylglycerol--glycerol-3-phosphate 3-phosphatidyltransferase [Zeta